MNLEAPGWVPGRRAVKGCKELERRRLRIFGTKGRCLGMLVRDIEGIRAVERATQLRLSEVSK